MDTITHVAIGACIGEILLGKKLGKRAMLLGAIANSIPDVDFVASLWMNPANNLLAHRGFTHSFLFAILTTPFLALYAEYVHRPHNISLRKWVWFFGVQLFCHLFIDAFNSYGIGWFEPFSHYRISFNAIFVADPFFSVSLGLAFAALLILRRKSNRRKLWAYFGITASSLYLLYCLINKFQIDSKVNRQFAEQKIVHTDYFTTPTPLNNLLWYIVAKNDSGYNIGYASVFDKTKNIDFHFFPRNDSLLKDVSNQEDLQHLIRFSKGFYTVEKWSDTLVFNDLRFGQITGWQNPNNHFVFHYYLQYQMDNKLVVQRGRFENWNLSTVKFLIKRIEGN